MPAPGRLAAPATSTAGHRHPGRRGHRQCGFPEQSVRPRREHPRHPRTCTSATWAGRRATRSGPTPGWCAGRQLTWWSSARCSTRFDNVIAVGDSPPWSCPCGAAASAPSRTRGTGALIVAARALAPPRPTGESAFRGPNGPSAYSRGPGMPRTRSVPSQPAYRPVTLVAGFRAALVAVLGVAVAAAAGAARVEGSGWAVPAVGMPWGPGWWSWACSTAGRPARLVLSRATPRPHPAARTEASAGSSATATGPRGPGCNLA